MKTLCGIDCGTCELRGESCGGCAETNGHPFGGTCVFGECVKKGGCENAGHCFEKKCTAIEELKREIAALGIEELANVERIALLPGSFVNLMYPLPGGGKTQLWEDGRVYFCIQVEKKGSDRCYGVTADENYLLVAEYGENGVDPEIIVLKKRKG